MRNASVTLTVPSTFAANLPANPALLTAVLVAVYTRLSNLFGGCTAVKGVGSWVSEEHGLITEDVTLVTSYATPEDVRRAIPDVIRLALYVCEEMQQECVSLNVNGTLYFVDRDTLVFELSEEMLAVA